MSVDVTDGCRKCHNTGVLWDVRSLPILILVWLRVQIDVKCFIIWDQCFVGAKLRNNLNDLLIQVGRLRNFEIIRQQHILSREQVKIGVGFLGISLMHELNLKCLINRLVVDNFRYDFASAPLLFSIGMCVHGEWCVLIFGCLNLNQVERVISLVDDPIKWPKHGAEVLANGHESLREQAGHVLKVVLLHDFPDYQVDSLLCHNHCVLLVQRWQFNSKSSLGCLLIQRVNLSCREFLVNVGSEVGKSVNSRVKRDFESVVTLSEFKGNNSVPFLLYVIHECQSIHLMQFHEEILREHVCKDGEGVSCKVQELRQGYKSLRVRVSG